jgi:regulator of RNase E activity RraA
MRDLQVIDKKFQILSGEIRVGHGYNQIQKLNCKVNIFNMEVHPNDIIHADLHGAVIIKRDYLKELPSAIKKMVNKEKIIIDFMRKNKNFSKIKFLEKYKQFMSKK